MEVRALVLANRLKLGFWDAAGWDDYQYAKIHRTGPTKVQRTKWGRQRVWAKPKIGARTKSLGQKQAKQQKIQKSEIKIKKWMYIEKYDPKVGGLWEAKKKKAEKLRGANKFYCNSRVAMARWVTGATELQDTAYIHI